MQSVSNYETSSIVLLIFNELKFNTYYLKIVKIFCNEKIMNENLGKIVENR